MKIWLFHIIGRFRYLKIAIFGTFLSVSALGSTFPKSIEFERISRKEGLPDNSVTSIIQDRYGMLWFGTYNGLSRYDGYNFKTFVHSSSDTTTITESFVRALTLTKEGNILVAHDKFGFEEVNVQTEKITRVKYNNPLGSENNFHIMSILDDKKGNIWLGTSHGLSKYNSSTKKFKHYSIDFLSLNTLKVGFVSSILDLDEDYFLLYLSGYNIVKFNKHTAECSFLFSFKEPDETEMLINKGGTLLKDKKGYLWMGTEFKGLYRIEMTSGKSVVYNVEQGALSSNVILDIKQDSQGRLWVASDGGGLMEYDYISDSFHAHKYDGLNNSSISSNAVYYIYEDRSKNIWLGNYATGLNVIMHNKRKFEAFTNQGIEGYKLSYKSVLSFEDAGDGNVWVGTDGGGVNLFNPKTKTFRAYTKENSGICSNIVKSLMKDHEGNLWIGTYASGLCKTSLLPDGSMSLMPFTSSDGSKIRHLNVWDLKEDRDHTVWIGLLEVGLDGYLPVENKFVSYPYSASQLNGLSSGNIRELLLDNKDNLWLGTETGGICLFDRRTKQFASFVNVKNDPESLPGNDVMAMMQDSDGAIWVGTKQGGLSVLVDAKRKKFKTYNTADGLSGNTVFGILEDDHRNLWISTDNGICLFDRKKGIFKKFDLEDGLQSLEYNMGACYKDKEGFLYFGGPDGFNRFHPDKIQLNRSIPEVYISQIKLFNKCIEANVSYHDKVYFKKPAFLLDTLELDYEDHSLTLEFVCTNYISRSHNQFAYRLSGFHTSWDTVDASKRYATYTNLQPGKYIFQVRASNNDGIWNVKGKKLVIIVHPPWWMAWWFKIGSVIAVVFALLMLYYGRISQIKKRNTVLSKLVKYRTRELEYANNALKERNEEIMQINSHVMEQQNEIIKQKEDLEVSNIALNESNATKDKFFSIVAHDLRNPVSALNALTEMLQSNYNLLGEKDRSQIVGHIQSSSRSLKYLVNNLLDWALIQTRHLKVSPSGVNLDKSVEECFKVLKLQAADKEIVLENKTHPEHTVLADPNMLQTVLRNLVSNGIKFSLKKGRVLVQSEQIEEGKIVITVCDTGVGMTEERMNQLFSKEKIASTSGTSNEKGTGLGLVIVQEFIEVNHGYLEVKSVLNQGTRFAITLPIATEKMINQNAYYESAR